jgi:hypothetical protein
MKKLELLINAGSYFLSTKPSGGDAIASYRQREGAWELHTNIDNFPAQTSDNSLLSTEWTSVQVCGVHMHFTVKGFKIITLHSNFQTFLQHFTKKRAYIEFWPSNAHD